MKRVSIYRVGVFFLIGRIRAVLADNENQDQNWNPPHKTKHNPPDKAKPERPTQTRYETHCITTLLKYECYTTLYSVDLS